MDYRLDDAMPTEDSNRVLHRLVAREMTAEEIDQISGGLRAAGTTSCSCGCDDCDSVCLA
ncbi:MAG TPA: hypothetical protein VME92_17985 [Acetobacteraceae bacterium]|nr:hypothetical protein [Acetobacteraceae bacterium]